MRRIVFAGNRQLLGLCALYRQFVAPQTGDTALFVERSPGQVPPETRRVMRSAQVLVVQALRTDQNRAADTPPGAQRHAVPLVRANFLWPFPAAERPGNAGTWFLPEGPYGAGFGDSWLNRMIGEGVPPAAAAARYVELDVAAEAGLDRLYEQAIAGQRARDQATGFNTAAVIEESFRDTPAFLTPLQPGIPVLLHLAAELFGRLDAPPDAIERMRALTRRPGPDGTERPLHPAVIRHFGLRYADPDRRYRFLHEGRFTFAESAERYMRGSWNPALEEGIALLAAGKRAQAAEKLREGLAASPDSAAGRLALSRLLAAADPAGALEEARQAVALDPDDPACQAWLAELLARAGEPGAVPAFTRALELNPTDTGLYESLARAFTRGGQLDQALSMIRTAAALNPFAWRLHRHLGSLLAQAGDPAGACQAYGRALQLNPGEPQLHASLSRALAWQGRMEEAFAAAERGRELAPSDPRMAELMEGLRSWQAHLEDDRRIFREGLALEVEQLGAREPAEKLLS